MTDWREIVAPDEEERFQGYAEEIRALQRRRSAKAGSGRGLHRKGIGGVEARFTVRDDVPEALRVGPFAPGATFRAYVRFSNGGARREPDSAPDVRGASFKLLGVDGPKVLGEARTQDFLLIHRSVQVFHDPDEFVRFVRVANGHPATLPLRLARAFGPIRAIGVLRGLLAVLRPPISSFVTARWWSALPIRWGDTAARYSLIPVDPPEPDAPVAPGPESLSADLAARLRTGPIRYDFAVQTWKDELTTPIEDAAVDWPTPYTTIARLELDRQDLATERARAVADYVERLSFDPWHAVEALRPLGAMMRARKHAYYASTQERGALPEPDGTEVFPGDAPPGA